jgi:hypothetical protein
VYKRQGEELTFDYKYQRYGFVVCMFEFVKRYVCCREEAQKCLCGSEKCRGTLGGEVKKNLLGSEFEAAEQRHVQHMRCLDDEVGHSFNLYNFHSLSVKCIIRQTERRDTSRNTERRRCIQSFDETRQ